MRHYFLVSECLEPSKVAATRTKKEAKGPLPHSWAKVCSSRLRATYTHLCLYAIFELGCTISLWPKLPNFVQKWSCLRNFEVYIGHCASVRGAALRGGVHDPKMYRPFTFPCNFFPSPSKKCLIRPANLIWLVGSYSLTHSLIWPTTDLLIDMHFLILGPSIRSHSIFRFQVGHSNNSHHSNKWRVSLIVFFRFCPFFLLKFLPVPLLIA